MQRRKLTAKKQAKNPHRNRFFLCFPQYPPFKSENTKMG
ncbi:hypothetical protein EVA_11174 [gut metagenome]|uniref:Uncharacterized protein n=1 Tax=gut metagenome TaxID=749906 RepID=J9CKX6_9ZZZZ